MTYKEIRRQLKKINTKIFSQAQNNRNNIIKGAKLLGFKVKGKEIHFNDESEQDIFWDFLTYEKIGEMSLFDSALQYSKLKDKDKEFLKKITVFESAIYRIGNSKGDKVSITNIETEEQFDLHDINLAKTNISRAIIFLRMLHIDGYYMTSGFNMLFNESDLPAIQRRMKSLMKTEYKVNKSITKLRVMSKLNRIFGRPVRYHDV